MSAETGASFARNQWYVAAWRHELGGDDILARTVLGIPIALYRTAAGAPVALRDQCAHRQAPLSLGERDGDAIRCNYHGLVYDSAGACIHVPGQSHIPPGAVVRSYPAVDRWDWIWVWPGDPDKADESLIPALRWNDDPAWTHTGERMHMRGRYDLLVENLLDLSHLGYLHRRTIGTTALSEMAEIKSERTGRGVRMTRLTPDSPPPPIWQKTRGFKDNIDRWQIVEFVPPSTVFILSLGAPAGQCQTAEDALDYPCTVTCHSVTPETDSSLHYFWTSCRNHDLDDEEMSAFGFHQAHMTFLEDTEMIEGQQRNFDRTVSPSGIDTNNDAAVLRYRDIMRAVLEAEQAELR